ncbi:MAG: phenylacetate-CoA oxygenase subunit PaaI [Crocinitomicaceae bacterium]|nr:phenylacetate-CoA oxygenase subunit PaaI [Crocinitomicaceae bacterium]
MTDSQLKEVLLRLGDDTLVLAQRLGEWCGHAPILEEDIALTNISLDLLGRTQNYLKLAGKLHQPTKSDDDLAFHRDPDEFTNLLLLEQSNGHFGDTICRQFLFDNFSLLLAGHLATQEVNTEIAAIAAKAIKEIRYHVDHSSKWVLRLGGGTAESHEKIQGSLDKLWQFTDEMFEIDEVTSAAIESGLFPDLSILKSKWLDNVMSTLTEAGLSIPSNVEMKYGGRNGNHTPHLAEMLEVMQVLPRTYPGTTW